MSENAFTKRYKTYTVLQLVEILENRNKYQPVAISAARAELEIRNVGPTEIQDAKNELAYKARQITEEQQARRDKLNQIRSTGESIAKHVASPVTTSATSADKGIKAISIVFFIQFLWLLPDQFDMADFLLNDLAAKWEPFLIFIFLPSLMIPPAIVLFWMKKRIGWILLATHILYSLLGPLFMIAEGYLEFGTLLIPLQILFIAFLFFGVTLYYILTEKIKAIFGVSREQITASSILALILAGSSSWAMVQ